MIWFYPTECKRRWSAAVCLVVLAVLFSAHALAQSSNPFQVMLTGQEIENPEGQAAGSTIRAFLQAAARGDRARAKEYANMKIYKTPGNDRTELLEHSLEVLEKNGAKAQWITVSQVREVQFNGGPAFAVTVEALTPLDGLTVAIFDMVWQKDGSAYKGVFLSDLSVKTIINSED